MIIKDSSDLVLASCTEILSKAYTNNEVEALAWAKALSFAKELGITNCSKVICWLLSKPLLEDGSLASYGLLVEDVKIHSQCFDQLLYSHIKRESNSVTHSLVRYTINILDFLLWMEDVPP